MCKIRPIIFHASHSLMLWNVFPIFEWFFFPSVLSFSTVPFVITYNSCEGTEGASPPPLTTVGFRTVFLLFPIDAFQLFCYNSLQFPGLSCGSDPRLPGNVWVGRVQWCNSSGNTVKWILPWTHVLVCTLNLFLAVELWLVVVKMFFRE